MSNGESWVARTPKHRCPLGCGAWVYATYAGRYDFGAETLHLCPTPATAHSRAGCPLCGGFGYVVVKRMGDRDIGGDITGNCPQCAPAPPEAPGGEGPSDLADVLAENARLCAELTSLRQRLAARTAPGSTIRDGDPTVTRPENAKGAPEEHPSETVATIEVTDDVQ